MPKSFLFGLTQNHEFQALSTCENEWQKCWPGPCRNIKKVAAVPNFLWAIGSDFQVYLYVYGLNSPILVQEEVYENERWLPLDGFSSKLLPTDRYHYSSEDGLENREIGFIRIPSMAWQWESDWKLEETLDGQPLDADGWTYAIDFVARFSREKQWNSCVRRRKWTRKRRYSAMNAWCAIAPLNRDATKEPFLDISIGGETNPDFVPGTLSVWAVTCNNRLMYRSNVSAEQPEGTRWTHVSAPNGHEALSVTVASNGTVWLQTVDGQCFVRVRNTNQMRCGDHWLIVMPPETHSRWDQLACGTNAAWALDGNGTIWFRSGIVGELANANESMAIGSKWIEMVGSFSYVSVTANDQVFAVNRQNNSEILFRSGITQSNPTGNEWQTITIRENSECVHLNPTSFINYTDMLMSGLTSVSLDPLKNERIAALEPVKTEKTIAHSAPIFETEIQLEKISSATSSAGSQVAIEASELMPVIEDETITNPLKNSQLKFLFLEAKSLLLDLTNLPPWFPSDFRPNSKPNNKWQIEILAKLKNRPSIISSKWSSGSGDSESRPKRLNYQLAIDKQLSWTKKWNCRYSFLDDFHDGSLRFECFENRSGLLSIFDGSPSDDKCLYRFAISEIKAVIRSWHDFATMKEDAQQTKSFGFMGAVSGTSNNSRSSDALKLMVFVPAIFANDPVSFLFDSEIRFQEILTLLNNVCRDIHIHNDSDATKKTSDLTVWVLNTLGDVFLCDLRQQCDRNQFDNRKKSYQVDYDLALKNRLFRKIYLSEGCFAGTEIKLYGCINSLSESVDCNFAVNLENESYCSKNNGTSGRLIAFHFNVRFDEKQIVCNTHEPGTLWGRETRYENKWFRCPSSFSMQIVCESDAFHVRINDSFAFRFPLRFAIDPICQLTVRIGDTSHVNLFKITYQTLERILNPSDFNWFPVHGHFRSICTSSGCGTFAIASDSTVYSYVFGDESIANRQQEDFQNFFIYENQRWNLLTGYTNIGLPTDRPMWSDESGLKKMSKDNFRLPSSWSWISDWIVDYGVAGGTDEQGWQYAIDFQAKYHCKNQFTDLVRRRRWFRRCKITLPTNTRWSQFCNMKLSSLSVTKNAASIWAVTTKGDVVYRENCSIGDHWAYIDCLQKFKSISCGRTDNIWALVSNSTISRRIGFETNSQIGTIWITVKPPSKHKPIQIAATLQSVIVLDSNGRLFLYENNTETVVEPNWLPIDSHCSLKIQFITVDTETRDFWALDSQGRFLKRFGVSEQNNFLGYCWIIGPQINNLKFHEDNAHDKFTLLETLKSKRTNLGNLSPFLVHYKDSNAINLFLAESETGFVSNIQKELAKLFQIQINNEIVENANEWRYRKMAENRFVKNRIERKNEIDDNFLVPKITRNSTVEYEILKNENFFEKIIAIETIDYELFANNEQITTINQQLIHFETIINEIHQSEDFDSIVDNWRKNRIDKIKKIDLNMFNKHDDSRESKFETKSKENFSKLKKFLARNAQFLMANFTGTSKSSETFLTLYRLSKSLTVKEMISIFEKFPSIKLPLIDLLGFLGTKNSYLAAKKLLSLEKINHFDDQVERYLWSLAASTIGTMPNTEFIVDNLLHIFRNMHQNKKQINAEIRKSLLFSITALASKLKHTKIFTEIETYIHETLAKKDANDAEKSLFVSSLINLKSKNSLPHLSQLVRETRNRKLAALAMKTIRSLLPLSDSDCLQNRQFYHDVFFQLRKPYDSSARIFAVDIIFECEQFDPVTIRNLVRFLVDNRHRCTPEIKQYVVQKFAQLREKNHVLAREIDSMIAESLLLKYYGFLWQPGLSTIIERDLFRLRHGRANYTIKSIQEIFQGLVKRGIVSIDFDSGNRSFPLFNLGLFSSGLNSMIGYSSTPNDYADDNDDDDETENVTAGMELAIFGNYIRPFVFFNSNGELMGHVWSGTASEKTTALQQMLILNDNSHRIQTNFGIEIDYEIQGAVSFDLSGKIEISIWNRNSNAVIEKRLGFFATQTVKIKLPTTTEFVQKQTIEIEPTLDLFINSDFSSDIALCLRLDQPEFDIRKHFKTSKNMTKTSISEFKQIVNGQTFNLNSKNNHMCNRILMG